MNTEDQLDVALLRLHTAKTPAARSRAWADIQRLHKKRASDPARVAELERERGLSR